jgi:orc1/cdc6 family replication initiation protein
MESAIIRNLSVFDDSYLPTDILHREAETRDIAHEMSMFAKGYPARVVIYGPPGTGKTTVMKHVSGAFQSHATKLVYANALLTSTKLGLFSLMCDKLGIMMPRRGISPDELISRIREGTKRVLVVIDEADSLKEDDLLYMLAKSKETMGVEIGFIAITNVSSFLAMADPRLPALITKRMEFKPYSPAQVRDILFERAKLGLVPGAFDENTVGKIAGFAARHMGNVRLAIYLLLLAAKRADAEDRPKIRLEDLEDAKKDLMASLLEKASAKLTEAEKKVIQAVESLSSPTSAEIEEKLAPGMSPRAVRLHLKGLLDREHLLSEDIRAAGGGKKRAYRVAYKL